MSRQVPERLQRRIRKLEMAIELRVYVETLVALLGLVLLSLVATVSLTAFMIRVSMDPFTQSQVPFFLFLLSFLFTFPLIRILEVVATEDSLKLRQMHEELKTLKVHAWGLQEGTQGRSPEDGYVLGGDWD